MWCEIVAVIFLSFEQDQYTFLEGDGTVQVCVELSGATEPLEDPVRIDITSLERTALSMTN